MSADLRALVAKGLSEVINKGNSLTKVLPNFDKLDDKNKALARELTFGTLRKYYPLEVISEQLLNKPLKKKDNDLKCLILVGLYQLFFTRIPDHAVLSETVQATISLKKKWAKNLINALLRKALRESEQLLSIMNISPSIGACLPKWLFKQLKQDWPNNFEEIAKSSHQRAPLTLRVNKRHGSRGAYLSRLNAVEINAENHPIAEQALLLEKSCDITKLPGYLDGDFSVQDSAAQMAAQLLDVKAEQRILDACAAPGGKTAHILELTDNNAKVLAIDNSARRLQRLDENMSRLKLNVETIVADASDTNSWFEGEMFDRILCDAPCSALGIIRRHPDITVLRRESDIVALNAIQQQLLDSLWQCLKPGGIMLYSTCSILKSENTEQISHFLSSHNDAALLDTCPVDSDIDNKNASKDWQIFPGELKMDGFYYAKLYKSAS
ncbi:MAG: 16S rRNA (cytosine(967)-C(5))-methyltransferase RsmB [Gammaproteobacteria bacterium]|nr:16S rRNA (cytosine(967)-C(5))-methyltransferase RsmB [Gammaproteobacteria bacterium]